MAAGAAGSSGAQTAAFVSGYAGGVTVYALIVATCFRRLQRFLQPGSRWARLVTGLYSLCLIGLAIGLGRRMIG